MENLNPSSVEKSPKFEPMSPSSPLILKTPHKQIENGNKQISHQNQTNMRGINMYQNHMTPPSGLTKFIARNPFDADLKNRLHLSVISPTIFTKVSSPDSPAFSWTIDELAMMSPAKIDDNPHQYAQSSDSETETYVQKAIDEFFSESQIHPSPWSLKKEPVKPLVMLTPSRPVESLNTSRENSKPTRTCWSQTELTLPPNLPKDLEDALKPYFTFNQDQNIDNDEANTSNNSLRRKLFMNHEETTDDDEDEESFNISPIKFISSPAQSGFCINGTPLRRPAHSMPRNHGTPTGNYGNVSPPDMSPISNTTTSSQASSQGNKSRYRFAAKLDFTSHMSIDASVFDDKNSSQVEEQQETIENDGKFYDVDDGFNENKTVEMVSVLQDTPLKKTIAPLRKIDFTERDYDNGSEETASSIVDKVIVSNNNFNSNNAVGQFEQSSAFQLQDTGYQTNSISNVTDNNNQSVSVKKSFSWDDKVLANNVQSSEKKHCDWQDNMKIMFSSTPSKYTRLRDNC